MSSSPRGPRPYGLHALFLSSASLSSTAHAAGAADLATQVPALLSEGATWAAAAAAAGLAFALGAGVLRRLVQSRQDDDASDEAPPFPDEDDERLRPVVMLVALTIGAAGALLPLVLLA